MHHVRNGGLSVECVLGECSLLSVGVGFDSVFTVFSVVCVCPDYMPIIDTSWGMPATPCPMVRRHSRHFAGPGHTNTSILFVCTSPHAHLSAPRQWLLRRSGTACAMGLAGIPEDTARESIHRKK